jgi:hypothetical protein
MTIIKTQGVKISAPFPSFDVCPTQRVAPFNDLDIVGASATALDIKGIKEIIVYSEVVTEGQNTREYLVGIESIYKLSSDVDSLRILHGRTTEYLKTIKVEEDERIIAAFVGVNSSDPKYIEALLFTKTNTSGAASTEGFVARGQTVEYNATFGDIVAFHGITLRGEKARVFSIGFQTRSDPRSP